MTYSVLLSCSHETTINDSTLTTELVVECPQCQWGRLIAHGTARPVVDPSHTLSANGTPSGASGRSERPSGTPAAIGDIAVEVSLQRPVTVQSYLAALAAWVAVTLPHRTAANSVAIAQKHAYVGAYLRGVSDALGRDWDADRDAATPHRFDRSGDLMAEADECTCGRGQYDALHASGAST